MIKFLILAAAILLIVVCGGPASATDFMTKRCADNAAQKQVDLHLQGVCDRLGYTPLNELIERAVKRMSPEQQKRLEERIQKNTRSVAGGALP
jgi:hypothetical protein